MEKSTKNSINICLISIIPLIISLIMTTWFSFEVSLLVYVVTPVYLILIYIAIFKYARKEVVYHSFKLGNLNARFLYFISGIIPFGVLILAPGYNILYVGLELILFALWGVICILDIIAAFVYKIPKKPE